MEIKSVKALPEFKLEVVFHDGITGVVKLQEFIKTGVFAVLQNVELFEKVYSTAYSIAWNDELEIDSLTVYAELVNKTPEELVSADLGYAAN